MPLFDPNIFDPAIFDTIPPVPKVGIFDPAIFDSKIFDTGIPIADIVCIGIPSEEVFGQPTITAEKMESTTIPTVTGGGRPMSIFSHEWAEYRYLHQRQLEEAEKRKLAELERERQEEIAAEAQRIAREERLLREAEEERRLSEANKKTRRRMRQAQAAALAEEQRQQAIDAEIEQTIARIYAEARVQKALEEAQRIKAEKAKMTAIMMMLLEV